MNRRLGKWMAAGIFATLPLGGVAIAQSTSGGAAGTNVTPPPGGTMQQDTRTLDETHTQTQKKATGIDETRVLPESDQREAPTLDTRSDVTGVSPKTPETEATKKQSETTETHKQGKTIKRHHMHQESTRSTTDDLKTDPGMKDQDQMKTDSNKTDLNK